MKEIEIRIAPDGTTNMDAKGFEGSDCAAATSPYSEALGGVVEEKPKPEMEKASKTATRRADRKA